MDTFETPKVFRANPSKFKKRAFLVAGLTGACALLWAFFGKGGVDVRGYFFAGGIVLVIFSVRFWSMQVWKGPSELTFDSAGVTLADTSSRVTVPWAELQSIRYWVDRGGHYWRIQSRTREDSLDYYLDGLTHRQREELRETIESIQRPDVKIVPYYNPFEAAA
jgi:hypothetical protein